MNARDGLAVLHSVYLENPCLLDYFGREVRPVVVSDQGLRPQVLERRLSDHKSFIARAHLDLAAKDEMEAVWLDPARIQDRIEELLPQKVVLIFSIAHPHLVILIVLLLLLVMSSHRKFIILHCLVISILIIIALDIE